MLRNVINDLENKIKFKGDLMLGASEKIQRLRDFFQLSIINKLVMKWN